MSVVWTFVMITAAGMLGGLGYALMTYGGMVRPTAVKRNVKVGSGTNAKTIPVEMWAPGVIGEVFIGALSAVLVLCIFGFPTALFADKTVALTFYAFGTAMLAGLSGTAAISQLIEKKQWTVVASALAQRDPTTQPSAVASTPVETLRTLK
jgi:hypothetical protein